MTIEDLLAPVDDRVDERPVKRPFGCPHRVIWWWNPAATVKHHPDCPEGTPDEEPRQSNARG